MIPVYTMVNTAIGQPGELEKLHSYMGNSLSEPSNPVEGLKEKEGKGEKACLPSLG